MVRVRRETCCTHVLVNLRHLLQQKLAQSRAVQTTGGDVVSQGCVELVAHNVANRANSRGGSAGAVIEEFEEAFVPTFIDGVLEQIRAAWSPVS